MNRILKCGLLAGLLLFVISATQLFIAIQFFPFLFQEYILETNLFDAHSTVKSVLFYLHPFVISFALSWFWDRFKPLFKGGKLLRGLEFGLMYTLVGLIPVMWITFCAIQDITIAMIASWIVYGTIQSTVAGVLFAKLNP